MDQMAEQKAAAIRFVDSSCLGCFFCEACQFSLLAVLGQRQVRSHAKLWRNLRSELPRSRHNTGGRIHLKKARPVWEGVASWKRKREQGKNRQYRMNLHLESNPQPQHTEEWCSGCGAENPSGCAGKLLLVTQNIQANSCNVQIIRVRSVTTSAQKPINVNTLSRHPALSP